MDADEMYQQVELYKEKYNKLANHIYKTFPQHESEGPWGAVACARREIDDLGKLLADYRANAQPILDAKDHYRAEMVRAQNAEQRLQRENSFLKSIVKQFTAYLAS